MNLIGGEIFWGIFTGIFGISLGLFGGARLGFYKADKIVKDELNFNKNDKDFKIILNLKRKLIITSSVDGYFLKQF